MTWPTGAVNTANTDASTDSPANARADFLDLEQKVNQIIAHGAPVLQAGTQTIDGAKTFSSSPSIPTGSAPGHAVTKAQMDTADGLRLLKSANLSDVANAAAALANLGGVAQSSFTGSNQSLTPSGYQKVFGGLIVQWGYVANASPGAVSLTFPTSFPSSVAGVFISPVISAPIGTDSASISSVGLTGAVVNRRNNSGNAAWDFYYFAVGY